MAGIGAQRKLNSEAESFRIAPIPDFRGPNWKDEARQYWFP